MLKMAKDMSWIWPVPVRYPTDDGFKDGAFRARFKLLPKERREALEAEPNPVQAILAEAVVELFDLVQDDDVPMPLATALGIPFLSLALWSAYIGSTTVAPLKN
jgi:hypothetical protein